MQSLATTTLEPVIPPGRPLCLVVEDQALIGMAIEAFLEDAGYAAAGPFGSCTATLAWLEQQTPRVAVLDYLLKDGACVELARALRERGVPFLIYSGYRPSSEVPPELKDVPWLEKPCAREDMLQILADLAASSTASTRGMSVSPGP